MPSNKQSHTHPKNFDDLVIPTHTAGRKQTIPEFEDETGKGMKIPDKLSEEEMKFASPLIPILSEPLIMMLFAPDWHAREKSV